MRVIGPDAEQLGVVSIKRALELAQQHELDIVEIAPTAKPPVCRIMDYSKFKYDQEKKERRIKKNQKIVHLKQIRLKPHIEENDYQVKLRQIHGFLKRKDQVKVNMIFRGREMMHIDIGRSVLERIIRETAGLGQTEKSPVVEGKIMSVVFNPASEKIELAAKENNQ